MDHEAPGHPDLTHKPPLLDVVQWWTFCHAYYHQPQCPEGFTDEKTTYGWRRKVTRSPSLSGQRGCAGWRSTS